MLACLVGELRGWILPNVNQLPATISATISATVSVPVSVPPSVSPSSLISVAAVGLATPTAVALVPRPTGEKVCVGVGVGVCVWGGGGMVEGMLDVLYER